MYFLIPRDYEWNGLKLVFDSLPVHLSEGRMQNQIHFQGPFLVLAFYIFKIQEHKKILSFPFHFAPKVHKFDESMDMVNGKKSHKLGFKLVFP